MDGRKKQFDHATEEKHLAPKSILVLGGDSRFLACENKPSRHAWGRVHAPWTQVREALKTVAFDSGRAPEAENLPREDAR